MADKIILDYEAKYDKLKKELAEVKSLMKGTETAGKKSASETSKAFNAAGTSINRYGIEGVKAVTNVDKAIQRTTTSTRNLVATTNKVGERTAAGFNKAGDSIRNVGKTTSMFSQQVTGLANGGLVQLAGAMTAAFATQQLIAFAKESVAAAASFEKAVSELSSITGVMGDELEFYKQAAKELSVAEIGNTKVTSSAEEIVKAFSLVGSAKPELLASKEALVEVTKQAIVLAEASGLTLPEAVKSLTDVMNQFGAPAEQSAEYIDALAAGAKYGASAIPEVSQAIVKFGVAAKASNISVQESVALIETLGEKGLAGAEAGTALRSILGKLANAPVLPKDALIKFKQAGIDIGKLSDSSLPLEERLREASKLLKVQGGLVKVFGEEYANTAQALLQNIDRYSQLADQIDEVGVAQQQAGINTDNAAAKMKQFNNQVALIKIQLGDNLAPALLDAAKGISTLLKGDFSMEGVDNIGAGFDRMTTLLQELPSPIGGAIKGFKSLRGAWEELLKGNILSAIGKTYEGIANVITFGLYDKVKRWFTPAKKEVVNGWDEIKHSAELAVKNMTDQELAVELDRLAKSGKLTREEFQKLADKIKQAELTKIFVGLAQAISITSDEFKYLTDITDKYGISARTTSSLILGIRDATDDQLNKTFEKYNKTLNVTRKDWDDYIGKIRGFKSKAEEAADGQNKLTASTQKAIGPYEALTKLVSSTVSSLQDLAALALRGNSLEALGTKAEKLRKAQFDLALANNLVTISLGDYSKELEDLSKFMDTDGQYIFDIPGGKEQEARIKTLIDSYNEQIKKLKELKDINDELKKQDEENAKVQEDKAKQQEQIAEEMAQHQQDALDFLKSLGFEVNTEYQKQLNDLEAFYASKLITDEEYNLALQKLYGDQVSALAGGLANVAQTLNDALGQIFGEAAEKNVLFLAFTKALTIAQITLSAIQAVAAGIAKLASSNPLDIISGVASIIAGVGNLVGGLTEQVNSIAAPNIPKFYEGTDYLGLNGNPDGRDTIPILANKGEAIIPTARNSENPGLAKAWIDGNLDQFILTKYLPDVIEKGLLKQGAKEIHKTDWDDKNMVDRLDQNTSATIETNMILSKMLRTGKNPWTC